MQARSQEARSERPERRGGEVRRVPPGTFRADAPDEHRERRPANGPALVVVLAPLLGLGIWGVILFLLIGWLF